MESRWHAYARTALGAGVAVVLAAGAAVAAPAAEPPCARAARVSGSTDLVPAVVVLLREHGVVSDSACGERGVAARLQREPDGPGYRLRIEDGFGRTSERRVSDARTAASLIESWTLGEDAALLSPRAVATPVVPAAGSGAPAAPASAVTATGAEAAAPGTRWQVAAAAELALDTKGNPMWGGGARLCGRIGIGCLGGRARLATGREPTEFPGYDLSHRRAEVAAFAMIPWAWSRLMLAPALAVGVGWQRTSVPVPIPGLFPSSRTDTVLLAQPSLIGGVRLGGGWSLGAEVGVSLGAWLLDESANQVQESLEPQSNFTVRVALGVEYAR